MVSLSLSLSRSVCIELSLETMAAEAPQQAPEEPNKDSFSLSGTSPTQNEDGTVHEVEREIGEGEPHPPEESEPVSTSEWEEAFSGTVDGVAESIPHLQRNTGMILGKIAEAITMQVNDTTNELKNLSMINKIIASSMAELQDNISNLHYNASQLRQRSKSRVYLLRTSKVCARIDVPEFMQKKTLKHI